MDPEFPIKSSRVKDMLGKEKIDIKMIKRGDENPDSIAIGEAQTPRPGELGGFTTKTLWPAGVLFQCPTGFPISFEEKAAEAGEPVNTTMFGEWDHLREECERIRNIPQGELYAWKYFSQGIG
jgi:hypothetical protein